MYKPKLSTLFIQFLVLLGFCGDVVLLLWLYRRIRGHLFKMTAWLKGEGSKIAKFADGRGVGVKNCEKFADVLKTCNCFLFLGFYTGAEFSICNSH